MDDPLIGRVLKDTYRIDKPLTDGGMSLVYLAWQVTLSRPVVLKLLRPGFSDEDFIELFLREARISSQINHPNVVSVFDFGQTDDGVVYLAMELLEGETLGDLITATGPLALPKTLWLIEQVCNGMHAAHMQNVVHRDLKPHNIMISRVSGDDTIVKVLDFGISKPLSEEDLKHTRLGMVMGTPGYLATEQIEGQRQIDQRADVYAVGAILYFCITGQAPFKGGNREIIMNKQLDTDPKPLAEFDHLDATNPQIATLQDIVNKAMHRDRDSRYQTVKEVWQALQALTQMAGGASSIPAQTIVGMVTHYQFVVSGKRADDFDLAKAKEILAGKIKLSEKHWKALMSGKRVILAKNLSQKSAAKLEKSLKMAGFEGAVEEMPTATRIAPRRDTSMPTGATMEPVTLGDIGSLNQSRVVEEYNATHRTESTHPHTQPSQIIDALRAKKRKKKLKLSAVAASVVVAFLLTATFYKPLHYPIHDFWVYTIQGKQDARGVTPDNIKFGMSAAFSGSAKELGRSMRTGISAYFKAVNEAGGVHGRMLELESENDSYEPELAAKNIKQFINPNDGVLALIGNVGTPTAKAILPVALENNVIIFGTFSGASILRNNPPDRYVFNYRASYAQETEAMVHYFVQNLEVDPKKIAIFHQNDSFGEDGARGVLNALKEYKVRPKAVLQSVYERNTAQVEQAVFEFSADIDTLDAIIIVGTYSASAEFTKEVRNMGFEGQIANVSFVGARALAEQLLEFGKSFVDNILITQVVPMFDSYATGVIKYREDLERFYPSEEPNFVSLEGYIVAKVFVEALRRSGRYFTEEELVSRIEAINELDLGIGTPISFSASDHQASDRVWGTNIKPDGSFQQIDL